MAYEFKKLNGLYPWLLNNASTSEELYTALEDFIENGSPIIYNHNGDDCTLSSYELGSDGTSQTIIAYFITPNKKLLKVDGSAGWGLVVTESDLGGGNAIQAVLTSAEMNTILTNATSANVGSFYMYLGETTSTYKKGSVYRITE